MDRPKRAKIAAETLNILDQGEYINESGERVDLTRWLDGCLAGSASFDPDRLEHMETEIAEKPNPQHSSHIAVVNESTLDGAYHLAASGQFERVGVLNFASAKRPGGGFLNGSAAQEESLARSSALYASLSLFPDFYTFHRQLKQASYSDRMIYSPACPVFRDDAGQLLDQPYAVDFITSPAPNAGAMGRGRHGSAPKLSAILKQRAGKILALACAMGCDALVLGAWGCGVFRNDPAVVAGIFGELVLEDGPYFGRFKALRFSVLDDTPQQRNFALFSKQFEPHLFAQD